MSPIENAELLEKLGRIATALERIEVHLRPAQQTLNNGTTYTYSIAESLDRIGDVIAERGS